MKKKLISFGCVVMFIILIAGGLLYFWNEAIIKSITILMVIIGILTLYFKSSVGEKVALYIRGMYWSLKVCNRPKKLRMGYKAKIFNPKYVTIGNNCDMDQNVALCPLGQGYPSKIVLGEHVHLGAFDRIASMNEVRIDDNVLFAAFVHVTDHSHEYRNPELPVMQQGVYSKGPVHIKEGAWLAFGSHILSGVTVGEHSVVAANAVVTKDVPPYTVVAGNPARAVSAYNFDTKKWETVKK